MASPLQVHRAFTTGDLDAFPDDGNRYELVDGQLLVSPAPTWGHQEVVLSLGVVLHNACPPDQRVVVAPFDVRPDRDNSVQPDVLVARYIDLAPQGLPGKRLAAAPLLAVEVVSPSSKLIDATLKKAFHARLGVPSYWSVDPDPDRPRLTAFELVAGEYQDVADVLGDTAFHARAPFAVTVVPADLVRGLLP